MFPVGRCATLPPVDALDQLRDSANGRGIVDRLRSSRGLVVAVAGGILLLIAWVAWAVYVTSDNGGAAGLGVVIAWPALLVALALISLPFVGAYLLVQRLRSSEDTDAAAPDAGEHSGGEPEEEPADEAEGDEEDDGEEKDEGEDDEEEKKDEDEGEEDDDGEEAEGEEESPEPEEPDGDDEDEGDEEEAFGG
jgi:hypothetical protein